MGFSLSNIYYLSRNFFLFRKNKEVEKVLLHSQCMLKSFKLDMMAMLSLGENNKGYFLAEEGSCNG